MKKFLRMNSGQVYKYSDANEFYWSLDEYGDDEMGASKCSPREVLVILRNGSGELVETIEFKPKITWPRIFQETSTGNLLVYSSPKQAKYLRVRDTEFLAYTNDISTPLNLDYYKEIEGKQKEKLLNLFK